MAIISDDDKSIKKGVLKNPIIKSESIEYDKTFETSIRPKTFDDYIGQGELKETLKVTLEAAHLRNKPLDHMLFYGPPGLGKTTIAGVIASKSDIRCRKYRCVIDAVSRKYGDAFPAVFIDAPPRSCRG